MRPSSTRIDASQLDNQRTVLQSTKEVLVALFEALDIPRCARDSLLGAPQSKTKTEREAIYSELLACFEAESRAFLSRIITADKTWVHHFEQETKSQ
jgi:hypothetical protein